MKFFLQYTSRLEGTHPKLYFFESAIAPSTVYQAASWCRFVLNNKRKFVTSGDRVPVLSFKT